MQVVPYCALVPCQRREMAKERTIRYLISAEDDSVDEDGVDEDDDGRWRA